MANIMNIVLRQIVSANIFNPDQNISIFMHSPFSHSLYTRIHIPLPHFLERNTSEKFDL